MTPDKLLQPLTFRTGLVARNRAVLAPMTNKQSHADGTLGDDELRFLCSRAEGGFGLIMTCAAYVADDGKAWAGELGIAREDHLPGLARLAQALRERGAASIVQLFHGGLRADPALIGGAPWSASEGEGARAATSDDITRVIEQFAAAAARAQAAGFDGVELHGAHGYLLSQFLATAYNRRDDDFGGDIAGRARLVRQVLRAVRARTAPSFTVGVRLSPEDFGQARGLDLDESLQVARWLVEDGADFIHISLWQSAKNTQKRPEEHPIPLFRAVMPDDRVLLAAGSIWSRADADAVLARGADGVAIGRAALLNPEWPRRAADPAWEPRRPPVTVEELLQAQLSPTFAGYLRGFRGLVADKQ